MHYDGYLTAFPVVDNVVGLNFEYFGDPDPPDRCGSPVEPTTTYGPRRPRSDATQTAWAAGESCTFTVVGGQHQPRLASLGAPRQRVAQV